MSGLSEISGCHTPNTLREQALVTQAVGEFLTAHIQNSNTKSFSTDTVLKYVDLVRGFCKSILEDRLHLEVMGQKDALQTIRGDIQDIATQLHHNLGRDEQQKNGLSEGELLRTVQKALVLHHSQANQHTSAEESHLIHDSQTNEHASTKEIELVQVEVQNETMNNTIRVHSTNDQVGQTTNKCLTGAELSQLETTGCPEPETLTAEYEVVVKGINKFSMDMSQRGKNIIINRILIENYRTIPNARIAYICWLNGDRTPRSPRATVRLRFTRLEDANCVIQNGLIWEQTLYKCQRYEGGSRMQQCYNCQKYGHEEDRCNASVVCPYCAESHSVKSCSKRVPPKCANCGEKHVSYSYKCQYRRRAIEAAETKRAEKLDLFHVPNLRRLTKTTKPENETENVEDPKNPETPDRTEPDPQVISQPMTPTGTMEPKEREIEAEKRLEPGKTRSIAHHKKPKSPSDIDTDSTFSTSERAIERKINEKEAKLKILKMSSEREKKRMESLERNKEVESIPPNRANSEALDDGTRKRKLAKKALLPSKRLKEENSHNSIMAQGNQTNGPNSCN
jgi:hypothetical protein